MPSGDADGGLRALWRGGIAGTCADCSRFGGITAHVQAPAKGLWRDGSKTHKDDLVIFEVMLRKVDRKWWSHYRHLLQKRFRQKELLVRVQEVKVI